MLKSSSPVKATVVGWWIGNGANFDKHFGADPRRIVTHPRLRLYGYNSLKR